MGGTLLDDLMDDEEACCSDTYWILRKQIKTDLS